MSGLISADLRGLRCPVLRPVGAIPRSGAPGAGITAGAIATKHGAGILIGLNGEDGGRLAAMLHPEKARRFISLIEAAIADAEAA